MKKVLSVLLSVAMLIGCFSILAIAAPNDAVLKVTIKPTAASYSKGDVVTFEVFYETSDEVGLLSTTNFFAAGFDSSVYELIEDVSGKPNYDSSSSVIITGYPSQNNVVTSLSYVELRGDAYLSATDKAKGWDSVFRTVQTPTGGCDDDYSTEAAAFAFKLKIKDDASDTGCYDVGITDYSIQNGELEFSVNEELGPLFGASGTDFGFTTNNIFEVVDGTVTVAAAGPIVSYGKTQLKLNGTMSGVQYDVMLRITSVISDSDFDTYFANTKQKGAAEPDASTANVITSVGIVAFHGDLASFNETAAKALVTDGTATDGYESAETDYISKTSDTADATFGAIIRGSRAAFEDQPITFMGFVKYRDASNVEQVIFYATAVEKTVAASYFA